MKKYSFVLESFVNKLSLPSKHALMGGLGGMVGGTILGGGARAIHNVTHGKKWNDNLDRYALAGAGAGAALGAGAGYFHGRMKAANLNLQNQNQNLTAANNELQKNASGLANKLAKSKEEIAKLQSQSAQTQNQIKQLTAAVQSGKMAQADAQKQIEQLSKNLKAYQNRAQWLADEANRLAGVSGHYSSRPI